MYVRFLQIRSHNYVQHAITFCSFWWLENQVINICTFIILSQRDNDDRDTAKHNFVDIQFISCTSCEKWTEMKGYEVHRRCYTSSVDLCPYYVVSYLTTCMQYASKLL